MSENIDEVRFDLFDLTRDDLYVLDAALSSELRRTPEYDRVPVLKLLRIVQAAATRQPIASRRAVAQVFRRWHHGHSLGAGALIGLGAASYRVWLLMAFVFVLGVASTLLVVNGRRLLHWSRDMVAIWKLDRQDRQRARLERLKRRSGIPY